MPAGSRKGRVGLVAKKVGAHLQAWWAGWAGHVDMYRKEGNARKWSTETTSLLLWHWAHSSRRSQTFKPKETPAPQEPYTRWLCLRHTRGLHMPGFESIAHSRSTSYLCWQAKPKLIMTKQLISRTAQPASGRRGAADSESGASYLGETGLKHDQEGLRSVPRHWCCRKTSGHLITTIRAWPPLIIFFLSSHLVSCTFFFHPKNKNLDMLARNEKSD